MTNSIGDRMLDHYETRTCVFLPRRTYTILRVDGKAFHSYTRGLEEPFDKALMEDMDKTAVFMCANLQGCEFAFTFSDEISFLLTDFAKPNTDAYFDGNLQKITSVTASMATVFFNRERANRLGWVPHMPWGMFDARTFTIPDPVEVENYFIWRQQDASRNSVQMVARSLYSHKELHSKNTEQMQEMIFQKGVNWNDYSVGMKRGRMIWYDTTPKEAALILPVGWLIDEPPIFTQDRSYLRRMIPMIPDWRLHGPNAPLQPSERG